MKSISFKNYLNTVNQSKSIYKPVKRPRGAKKGGYPYGTKRGHGGLADHFGLSFSGDMGGGIGESYVAEMTFQRNYENEENRPSEIEIDEIGASDSDIDDLESDEANTDPNRQGLIRRVPNAHLVYKRQTSDGHYEEMWVYQIGTTVASEVDVKRAIIAGTDIDPQTGFSEDGEQTYDVWTAGNAQIIVISGLPN